MKLNLIYYKNLLDASIEKMFASIGSMFSRSEDGTYVLSSGWSKAKMSKLFEQCLKDSMLEIIEPSAIICFGNAFPEMDGNIIQVDYMSSRKVVRRNGR